MKKDKSKHLLVIDEDLSHIKDAMHYFESMGHQVDFAISGSQALRMMLKMDYNMIILDYHISEIDGIKIMEILAKRNYLEHNTIVMLTNTKNSQVAEKAIQLGVKEVLDKKQERFLLLGSIKNHL